MKKILALILCIALVFSLAACVSEKNKDTAYEGSLAEESVSELENVSSEEITSTESSPSSSPSSGESSNTSSVIEIPEADPTLGIIDSVFSFESTRP